MAFKWCLHRQENIICLSLSSAVVIWKDRRVSIEIAWLSKIAIPTSRLCTNLYRCNKTLHVCHYRQQWWFEKIGEFLLKSHGSAKLLYPHHICVRTFTGVIKHYMFVDVDSNGDFERYEIFHWNCAARQFDSQICKQVFRWSTLAYVQCLQLIKWWHFVDKMTSL